MVDRIKQVMEHYDETPAGFAEKIGVNRSNLTHLFTGRNQPSLDFAKKVLTAFPEVSTEWLIMGVGKMLKDPEELMPVRKTFVQTDLFDAVEESEKVVPSVNEVTIVSAENEPQQPSVKIQLENVKTDKQEIYPSEIEQHVDVKEVNSKIETKVTIPESNIQQHDILQPGKSDSQTFVREAVIKEGKSESPSIALNTVQAETVSEPVGKVSPTSVVQASQQKEGANPFKENKIEKIVFFYDDGSFKVYHP